MDKIIIDGCIIELDEWFAAQALKKLELAPEGTILVAVTSGEHVLVRWIDEDASDRILPALRAADEKIRSRSVKPTKKLCPWLFAQVENEFDQVAVEHSISLESMHNIFNDNLEQRGKRPESFRRWVSKIRKRWVKTVVANGKRVDDLESLVTYPM
jgi:hypothetical protein